MEGSTGAKPKRPLFNPPNESGEPHKIEEVNEDEAILRGSAVIKDHELLLCGSSFLLGRTGRGSIMEFPKLGSVLSEGVRAYGERGRDDVLEHLDYRATSFPPSVLSVTANARAAAVLVEYHDGSGETLRCGRDAERRVVVEQVDTHREPATTSSICPANGDRPSGVEQLWWAVRFLHADLSRDYAAQRRYLAPEAAAFGAVGREPILAANGERLAEEDKPVYSVPYPLTVDESSGTVVLMFDKRFASGELMNRGTDLMVVSAGLVQRIVTINHSSGVVYSPQYVEA